MGTPPDDVDKEKKIAVVFGKMCTAFAAGAVALGPSEEVHQAAFDRYHKGIYDALESWNDMKETVLGLARKVGTQAAINALTEGKTAISKDHFKAAAEKIEHEAFDSKVCERIKLKGRTCAICDAK